MVVLTACTNFLDIEPLTSRTEENFYKTEKDAFEALTSVYDVLQWGGHANTPFEVISEILADDCFGGGASASDIPSILRVDRHTMRPTDGESEVLWDKYYTGIYRANLFLEKIAGIGIEESLKKLYIAEVKFLRANYYFDLARLFGRVPLILKTLLVEEQKDQKQATPEQLYAQIAQDLLDAIKDLPATAYSNIKAEDKGRVTKWAAEAMLVRVALYYTGYYNKADLAGKVTLAKARELIDDVIDNSGHGLVSSYADLWQASSAFVGENNVESVFEIQYSSESKWDDWGARNKSEGNQAIILLGIRSPEHPDYGAGWSFAPVNSALWNLYGANDTRQGASIISIAVEFTPNNYGYTEGYQNTGYFNKKYTALKKLEPTVGSRELNYPNNYVAIRFADVLLMGAEIHLKTSGSKAQSYLDRVTTRAGIASVTANQQNIMAERHKELALEGHRYWDLLRQGLDVTKAAIDNTSGGDDFKVTFNKATKGLFPIPEQELLLNDNLSQNEGY